jgi:phosphoribosylformylglycinamidine synthase I
MKTKKPKSLVLFGNGINCEHETSHAHRLVGFDAHLLHINALMDDPKQIHQYAFINFPGGFLDGDDLGAAKAQAVKWKYQRIAGSGERFIDELERFVGQGKIMLGICNGFQLLVKIGLLPGLNGDYGRQSITLTFNDSGKFEDRWVYLKINKNSRCIFTRDMDTIYLPVRHGEGKLIAESDETLQGVEQGRHVVMQYARQDGAVTSEYPLNPNGSALAIAGVCDYSGRILGLMPHPEAFVHYTQHPRWTRESLSQEGDGLKIFRNAFQYVIEHL